LADGHTGHVELLSSSGYRSLDESAVKAVSSWRFAPATRGGTSVPCAIQVPVRFKLNTAGD
jgi:protein TonB